MKYHNVLNRYRKLVITTMSGAAIIGVTLFDTMIAQSLRATRPPSQIVMRSKPAVSAIAPLVDVNTYDEGQAVIESIRDHDREVVADSALFDAVTTRLNQSLESAPEAIDAFLQPITKTDPVQLTTNTRIVRAIDGDTLVINWKGKEETVRLIGVDTPESVDPRTTVQCFGREASEALKIKASGEPALFTIDPSQGERDKYNRLLGYVSLSNGTLINQWLIEEGYGFEYTYNLPYRYQAAFIKAEERAHQRQKGLWAPNTCNGERAPDSGSSWQPVGNDDRDCDAFTTQKEAQDFFESHGGNAASDPHNLDRDHDGIACELLP